MVGTSNESIPVAWPFEGSPDDDHWLPRIPVTTPRVGVEVRQLVHVTYEFCGVGPDGMASWVLEVV